jgi:type VI secretion system protein ImpE
VATARELFDAGKLNQAIEALGAELREHPTDTQRRTFLFEMLCFAGNWDRADKQLDVLAGDDKEKRMGALLYRAAISAERTRHEMFAAKRDAAATPATNGKIDPPPVSGTLNGKPFLSLEDADPRLGARLEIFAGENYVWIPLDQITSIGMKPPQRLRDLLWAPATVRTVPGFEGGDLGEVLLPVLSPFSSTHPDDEVRLGRMTVWEETPDGEAPLGQKMLLVDGEEIPLLDVRLLEISRPAES